MSLNKQDCINKGIFAPDEIVSSGTSALDVTAYAAIGSPNDYEYYINTDSANKMTRSGVLWITPSVTSVTFTTDTVIEVMTNA